MALLRVVWSETTSHEAVIEIPGPYDGSDQSQAEVVKAVEQFAASRRQIGFMAADHLEIIDVNALRAGSKAEVG